MQPEYPHLLCRIKGDRLSQGNTHMRPLSLRVRHYPSTWSEREVKEGLHLKFQANSYQKQKVSIPRAFFKKKKKKKKKMRGGEANRKQRNKWETFVLVSDSKEYQPRMWQFQHQTYSTFMASVSYKNTQHEFFFFLLKPTGPRINNIQWSFASWSKSQI